METRQPQRVTRQLVDIEQRAKLAEEILDRLIDGGDEADGRQHRQNIGLIRSTLVSIGALAGSAALFVTEKTWDGQCDHCGAEGETLHFVGDAATQWACQPCATKIDRRRRGVWAFTVQHEDIESVKTMYLSTVEVKAKTREEARRIIEEEGISGSVVNVAEMKELWSEVTETEDQDYDETDITAID